MYRLLLDPTNHHGNNGAGPERLIEACGLLPEWFADYRMESTPSGTLKEYMEECYGFGLLHEMTGCTINEDLTYDYPEDDTMYPLLHATTDDGKAMVQWQYGIVAFQEEEEGEWFMTRMD